MYAQDRDLFLDASYDVEAFKKQGSTSVRRTTMRCGVTPGAGWYADPRSKDFGANCKYVQHDVAEAKKLVTAAGAQRRRGYFRAHRGLHGRLAEAVRHFNGFAANSGAFKVKIVESSYAQGQFQTKYRDARRRSSKAFGTYRLGAR